MRSNSAAKRDSVQFSVDFNVPTRSLSKYEEKEDFAEGFALASSEKPFELKKQASVADWDEHLEESFDSAISSQNMLREKYRDQLLKDVTMHIEVLSSNQYDTDSVIKACNQLKEIFKHNPSETIFLITKHGLIPILEQLSSQNEQKALLAIMQLINRVVPDKDIQDAICLLGGIPIICAFCGREYSKDLRLEVAKFVKTMCTASKLTLHMFISCRAFPILTNLLEDNYAEFGEMIDLCIDSILQVFHLQTHIPKNTFCYLFSKAGLVDKLASSLKNVTASNSFCAKVDDATQRHVLKLADTLLLFSLADSLQVTDSLCRPSVLESLKMIIETVQPLDHRNNIESPGPRLHPTARDAFLRITKVIKNLTLAPRNRESLENFGFIEALVSLLELREGVLKINEIHNQVLNALFHLCQLNPKNQERAATAGIIGPLHFFIEEKEVLRELAVSILFSLPSTSANTRELLWKAGSLRIFVQLLKDPNWYGDAMEAIATWLSNDHNIETELLKDENLHMLKDVLKVYAKKASFPKVLQPFLNIVTTSPAINRKIALASNVIGSLVPYLLEDLAIKTIDAFARVLLLKILNILFVNAELPNQVEMIRKYRLDEDRTIINIANEDEGVIAKQMANQLLESFKRVKDSVT